MIQLRKSQLVIGLILACTCGLALCAETDETKTNLKFEIDNKESQLWIGDRLKNLGQGPIKPTHVAIFHIQRPNDTTRFPHAPEGILRILKSSAGKSLSEQQRQFLTASDAINWRGMDNIKNHDTVLLYAVSQEDAKKTVQAYLEVAIDKANSRMQERKIEIHEYEEKAAKAKKGLPEKEAELEAITVEYEIVKKKTHNLSSGPDAGKESKETILEMNKVLDSLAIEITGIEAKLSAVERIKSQRKVSSIKGLNKLEEIKSEQTVELAGALARKKAALNIREREEEFYGLHKQTFSLVGHVDRLKSSLKINEQILAQVREDLARIEPSLLPPKLYQDKVTIYPVLTE
jgi:chromosome segregation ATPase